MAPQTQAHQFDHGGHRVAIAVWGFARQAMARAEIYRDDELVCVVMSSVPSDRSTGLFPQICARAVRWINRHLR